MAIKFDFWKKLEWQDYLLAALVVFFFIAQAGLLYGLRQLPSPIYGGDYYHQLGSTNHLMYGGAFMGNEAILGAPPHYFPLYGLVVAGFSLVAGLSTMKATLILSPFLSAIGMILMYVLAYMLLKNKTLSILASLLVINQYPIVKYSPFVLFVLGPLFIIFLYRLYEKKSYLYAILTGVSLALISLAHSIGFVSMTLLFSLFSLFLLVTEYLSVTDKKFRFKREEFKKTFLKNIALIFIVLAIAVPVALISYWSDPIFTYRGQPLNALNEWTEPNTNNFSTFITFTITNIKDIYLNFSNIFMTIISLLLLPGIFLIFFMKEYDARARFVIFLLVSSLLITFHYFLTVPLFHTDLSTPYVAQFVYVPAIALFACFSASLILSTKLFKKPRFLKEAIIIAFIIIFIISQITQYLAAPKDRFYENGKNDLSLPLSNGADWVIKNTGVNDVFVTTNELGFSLNALTGRKLVTIRASHAGLFTNLNEREKDASILLYGDDDSARMQIIKKYNIKYLYWDYYWIQSEYSFDDKGNIANWFDPFLILYSEQFEKELNATGVEYLRIKTWVDPGNRNELVDKVDVMLVSPANYHNATHPWNPELDKYLKEAWSFNQAGLSYAAIYQFVNMT